MRGRRRKHPLPGTRLDTLAQIIAGGISATRVGIGLGMFLAPRSSLAALGFGAADGPILAVTRLAGARDIALGALTLEALEDHPRLSKLTLVSAGVDAADAAAFAVALAHRDGPSRGAGIGVVMAAQAAIVGTWAARRLG